MVVPVFFKFGVAELELSSSALGFDKVFRSFFDSGE